MGTEKLRVADDLMQKIVSRKAVVGVMGLGYVGLPLVLRFIEVGFRGIGCDVDARRVERLARGESEVLGEATHPLKTAIARGELTLTCEPAQLQTADCICICVPTPLDGHRQPDLSCMLEAAQMVAAQLHPGMLIVLESTSYPGTTREVVLPALAATGLSPGTDFFLAFSPERIDPGSVGREVHQVPKIVAGLTPTCARVAETLYATAASEVVTVSSLEAAEMVKLLENIYRSVNIAVVNELKMLCLRMGLDIWEVVRSAATKPFGFQAFYPGPGLGGHCIPIDPFYLSWKAREYGIPLHFVELAGEINMAMPELVARRVGEALNAHGRPLRGSRVLVLGVAYKKNIGDTRESPGIEIIKELRGAGADVSYHDPYVPVLHDSDGGDDIGASVPLSAETLAGSDCVVIVTDHDGCDYQQVVDCAPMVVDTRDATRGCTAPEGRVWQA